MPRGLKKTDMPANPADQAAFQQERQQSEEPFRDGANWGDIDKEHRHHGAPRSHGIGESRRFNADDGTPSELETLHFNGVAFADLPMERQELYRTLPNAAFASDEHVDRWRRGAKFAKPITEDEAEGRHRRERKGPKTDLARFEQRAEGADYRALLGEKREFMERFAEDEGPDPRREIIHRFVPRGFEGKTVRPGDEKNPGNKGYEVVRDEAGKAVMIGGDLLLMAPRKLVQDSRKRNEDRHNGIVADLKRSADMNKAPALQGRELKAAGGESNDDLD